MVLRGWRGKPWFTDKWRASPGFKRVKRLTVVYRWMEGKTWFHEGWRASPSFTRRERQSMVYRGMRTRERKNQRRIQGWSMGAQPPWIPEYAPCTGLRNKSIGMSVQKDFLECGSDAAKTRLAFSDTIDKDSAAVYPSLD